jgi:hypothetical protein
VIYAKQYLAAASSLTQAGPAARKRILPPVFCRLAVNHPPNSFGGVYEGRGSSRAFVFQVGQWPDPPGSFRRWRDSAMDAFIRAIDAFNRLLGSSSGFTCPESDSG